MTYLPATVIGRWFHLYLILDLYSRKIVGWEVHANDSSDHAVHLVRRTALSEGIAALTDKPGGQWLHAQGHHGACHARMAGCKAVVLTPSGQ